MSDTRRIAIVGGTPAALRKARAAGFEVVWIHHPRELAVEGLAEVSEALLTDYREPAAVAELLAAVHASRPLERVVSMIEDGLETAATATTALGLPGTGREVVQVLQDKLAFRSLLRARGVDRTAARIGHTEDDLREFVATYGPALIKPRCGSGSIGVRRVRGPQDVTEVAAWAADFGLHTFLMEEYLQGPEISVEAFSFAGRHIPITHTAKETLDSLVEIGHVQPAGLAPDLAEQVDDLVIRMLDAVGLQDGPSHTEIKLTPDGPRLIESHNRRGGDRIADLVQQVYGIDIDALAFLWYAGRTEPVTPGAPSGGAAIRFLTAEPGIVESVDGTESVRADPHVVDLHIGVAPGDVVPPVAWSYDRSGLLIVRGTDAQEARRRAHDLASTITIRTTPDESTSGARPIAAVAPRPDRLIGPAEANG